MEDCVLVLCFALHSFSSYSYKIRDLIDFWMQIFKHMRVEIKKKWAVVETFWFIYLFIIFKTMKIGHVKGRRQQI